MKSSDTIQVSEWCAPDFSFNHFRLNWPVFQLEGSISPLDCCKWCAFRAACPSSGAAPENPKSENSCLFRFNFGYFGKISVVRSPARMSLKYKVQFVDRNYKFDHRLIQSFCAHANLRNMMVALLLRWKIKFTIGAFYRPRYSACQLH